MAEGVTREIRIDSYDAMMSANANLMEEVYNDPKLTPAEKMKTFRMGISNQISLSRDLQSRRKEMFSYGMKADGVTKSLSFNPTEAAAAA